MYLPNATAVREVAPLHALIRAYPLGTWVTRGDDVPEGITADHVPFMLDDQRGAHGTLRCHVARANPLWRRVAAAPDQPTLVIFTGPDGYVSPSWYASKREHGKVVPTWNYTVVHVHGRAQVIDDRDRLRALVGELTDHHEAAFAHQWKVNDAPDAYVDQLLAAIVLVDIPIERIEGKWKLNQHRPLADRQGMVQGHRARGTEADDALARLVEQRIDDPSQP